MLQRDRGNSLYIGLTEWVLWMRARRVGHAWMAFVVYRVGNAAIRCPHGAAARDWIVLAAHPVCGVIISQRAARRGLGNLALHWVQLQRQPTDDFEVSSVT